MKIRTVKYIVKEGIVNTYRNKLMSLASIGTVTASLFIFGLFLLVAINSSYNTKILSQQPEMEIFCDPDLSDEQVNLIEEAINKSGIVEQYTKVTKQEAFDKVKKILGNDSNLLEGENESFLPISFIIKLKNSQNSDQAVEEFKKLAGVENIAYSQDMVQLISSVSHWVKIVIISLIVILLVISIFIISNTIKLTVFVRRKEISIMKYIGATDWFIRWPFVVEGMIIGFLGALVAFVPVGYIYRAVENLVNDGLLDVSLNFLKIVPMKEIGIEMFISFILISVAIGGLGSILSIRKHLHV